MASNSEPSLTSLSKIIHDLDASKQNAMLSVPTDLFVSLVSSVKDLSDSVSQLRSDSDRLQRELNSVRTDLVTLQQNVGARFPQFQRLPFELRQLIWRIASRTPQIHIIGWDMTSRSRINSILNTNREARSVVLELELDYILMSTEIRLPGPGPRKVPGTIKIYIDRDVDTFWLIDQTVTGGLYRFPEDMEWICGRCHTNPIHGIVTGCSHNCLSIDGNVPRGLKLAISKSSWLKPGHKNLPMGTMHILLDHEVKELLLIVGNPDPMERERDVKFVTPSQSPWYIKDAMPADAYGPHDYEFFHTTWETLERDMVQYMEKFKEDRARTRQELVNSGDVDSFEEMDLDPIHWDHVMDLSNWEIPIVKYVEARTNSHEWVLPPQAVDRHWCRGCGSSPCRISVDSILRVV